MELKEISEMTDKERKAYTQSQAELISKQLEKYEDSKFYNEMCKTMIINSIISKENIIPKKWYLNGMVSGSFKCDAKDCDWHSHTGIKLEDYYLWRNIPCPKCGANVYTDVDWVNTITLNKLMGNPIIRFSNWIAKKFCPEKLTKFKVEMNGTGDMNINKIDGPPNNDLNIKVERGEKTNINVNIQV